LPDTAGLRRVGEVPGPRWARGGGALPLPGQAIAHQLPRVADDAYSRRVAFLKRALPAIGVGLLLLVAGWPRLEPLLNSVRLSLPVIERRDARELRMVDPRYAGIDRLNRPYVLTAAAARQMPGQDDLMSLDRPRGELIAHGGAKIVLTAATGVYQTRSRLLDLFGDVTLTRDDGTRFVTQAAHLDLAAETANGHDPVAGRGPSGAITAQGFRILDKGDTIFFTGRSHVLLRRIVAARAAPPAPTLPAKVEETAARLAEAALATRAADGVAASRAPPAAERRRPTAIAGPATIPDPQGPAAIVSGSGRHAQ
jgi:lipopolysaccharide export system protein LptC